MAWDYERPELQKNQFASLGRPMLSPGVKKTTGATTDGRPVTSYTQTARPMQTNDLPPVPGTQGAENFHPPPAQQRLKPRQSGAYKAGQQIRDAAGNLVTGAVDTFNQMTAPARYGLGQTVNNAMQGAAGFMGAPDMRYPGLEGDLMTQGANMLRRPMGPQREPENYVMRAPVATNSPLLDRERVVNGTINPDGRMAELVPTPEEALRAAHEYGQQYPNATPPGHPMPADARATINRQLSPYRQTASGQEAGSPPVASGNETSEAGGGVTPDRVKIEEKVLPDGRKVKEYSQIGPGTVTLADVQRQGIGAKNPLEMIGSNPNMTAEEAKAETARRVQSMNTMRDQERLNQIRRIELQDGRLTSKLRKERDALLAGQAAQAQSQGKLAEKQMESQTQLEKARIYTQGKIDAAKARGGSGGGGKALPSPLTDKLAKAGSAYDAFSGMLDGFQDDYSGNLITGGLENAMGKYLPGEGFATPGQSQWWQNYNLYANQIRNDLFGSALTKTEKTAFDAAMINPRMTPDEVKKNLQRQRAAAAKAAKRLADSATGSGYSVEGISGALGFDPDEVLSAMGEQTKPRPGTGDSGMTAPQNVQVRLNDDQRANAEAMAQQLMQADPNLSPEEIADMVIEEMGI